MAKTININGVIICNDDKFVYNYFGIESVSPNDINKALAEANGEDVIVNINSNGGDVFAGSTIYDLLSSYKGNILIRVVGMAASAASVIACAGTSEIVPTAMIMIHNVSSYTEGDYNSMLHSAEVLQKANKAIATAYCRKTGLSEKELLSLMDKETYITAEEAVKQGFIDKIAEYEETSSQNKLALAASITGLLPEKTISKIRAERAKAQAKLELIKIKRSSASTRSSCG